MRYEAVIFDLFGTLVDDLVGPRYSDVFTRIASALSVPYDGLRQMWSDTYYQRSTGGFKTVEANIRHICRQLGLQPEDDDISHAARIRNEYARHVMMTPRVGAVEVLSELKERGYRIGLVSDCTPDAPMIWPETPFAPLFDAAVFSCVVGLKKPDHLIYELAIERLGVKPEDCLYVGNGGSDEHRGAYDLGMRPVLVVPALDSAEFLFRAPDEVVAFVRQEGAVISSLEEVLNLAR